MTALELFPDEHCRHGRRPGEYCPMCAQPIASPDDPPASREGARVIEPARGTMIHAALTMLLDARGEWIDTAAFMAIGKSGERRARELRDPAHGGWDVQVRRHPDHARTFQYRIDPNRPRL